MKRELLIFALLLLSIEGWAQRDYRKGYIVTHEQDTIYGWIDYRGDVRNAKVCSFKRTDTDKATEYSPSDIMAYRYIDSKYYVSRNISDDDAPKQVFLEYLVNGVANLYYYRDENTNEHYYIEKDNNIKELKVEKREVRVDGKTQVKTINSYVGVLKAMLNVWDMGDEIDKAKLEHESLINIAKDYHHYACTDGSECVVYEKKKPLVAMRIGPVVGADLSMINMKSQDVEGYDFDPSTNFMIGANLNFFMPRLNEKIFLQLQAVYTRYYFFSAYQASHKATDVHFKSNALQIGAAVKYEYPKGRWRPTFAAGAASIYLPDVSIKKVTDDYSYDVVRSATTNNSSKMAMFGFEIVTGIHYYFHKKQILMIQLQYLHCFHRKGIVDPASVIQSFGILTGIYF